MALPNNQWVEPRELAIKEMNALRGKLCSLIESMNLPNKDQEEAAITLLKQFSYHTQDVMAQLIERLDDKKAKFRYSFKVLEAQDIKDVKNDN